MAKRRAAGEGSVYKDGRYFTVAISLGDGERDKRRFKTEAEATRWKARRLHDLAQGITAKSSRITLAAFLEEWLKTACYPPRLAVNTYLNYERICRNHLVPTFGTIALEDLKPQQIDAFLTAKLAEGRKPGTVERYHACLRAALNQAVAWDMLPRNPVLRVDAPSPDPRQPEGLSVAEAREVRDALRAHRLWPLFAFVLGTATRQGEALGLTWEDLDLEQGTVHLRHQLGRDLEGHYGLTEPKSRSARVLDLPEPLVAILRRHRQQQDQAAEAETWEDHGLVFTTGAGRPLGRMNVTRDFKRLLRSAGLPEMAFHDLRHVAVSLQLADGVPLQDVSKLAGHRDVATTTRIYHHLLQGSRRRAAASLARVFEDEEELDGGQATDSARGGASRSSL